MKFLVQSAALLKQVQLLNGVLASNNTMPILDYFLFDLSEGTLTISASDLDTTMIARVSVESKVDFKCAVPARILFDTLKTLPDQPLTFTVDEKTFAIEIASDQGRYSLAGSSPDEYPKPAAMDGASSVHLEGDVLAKAINKTLFAAGNDEMRPVMNGIFFEMYPESLRFVATDAHRLVRYCRVDKEAGKSASFIVPRKPLNLLKSSVAAAGPVTLEYTDSSACFSFENITLMCRLIEGKYPNYEAVIPKENPNMLVVDRLDLLQSIRRVSIFANKTTHQVRLKINGSELTVSAEDLDYSNSASERLNCNYTGEDMEIAFNGKFLVDMLGNVNSENVTFELSAPNRAGIILPSEPESEGEEILMLVMPVMLNS